jgi:hypothetical protein
MESCPVVGISDVHTRTFAHGIQSPEDFDGMRIVGWRFYRIGHLFSLFLSILFIGMY